MSDNWDNMRRAKEDSYFEQQNKEALSRIKKRDHGKPRLSPITGEAMQELTIMGVAVDKCPTSGGIWLDAGELEQILKTAQKEAEAGNTGFIGNFLSTLFGAKK